MGNNKEKMKKKHTKNICATDNMYLGRKIHIFTCKGSRYGYLYCTSLIP